MTRPRTGVERGADKQRGDRAEEHDFGEAEQGGEYGHSRDPSALAEGDQSDERRGGDERGFGHLVPGLQQ